MSIETIFKSVKDGNTGEFMDKQQISRLSALKFRNNKKIINIKDTDLIYEIASSIEDKGFDLTYNFLSKNTSNDRNTIILEGPSMESSIINASIDMDIFRRSTTVETNITCPSCKSPNQMVIQVQVRSADEPMTTFIYCFRCGRMPYHQGI